MRVLKYVAYTFLVLFVLINAMLMRHAWLATNFTIGGERPKQPDQLTTSEKISAIFFGIHIPKPTPRGKTELVCGKISSGKISAEGQPTLAYWNVQIPNPTATVIMFHGYGGEKSSVFLEAMQFCKLGFETYLIDFRGSGESSENYTTIGYVEAEDVNRSFKFVSAQISGRPIYFYGKSMGSTASLRAAALLGAKPAAMILENPYDSLVRTIEHRFEILNLPPFPLADLLIFWGGLMQGFNGFTLNPEQYAESVTIPTLLIGGEKDQRVLPEELRSIYARLKGRKAIEIFPNVGHSGIFKSNPEHWKDVVSKFLIQ